MTACQGGGGLNGTNALPSSNSPTTNSSDTAAIKVAPPGTLLRSAPRGVRAYVHLPLRNRKELEQLIREQSSKNSPMYHRFLTVAGFRAKYGPTASDLQSAARILHSKGFTTTITSQGVVAEAPRSTVERVFQLRLHASPNVAGSRIAPLVADRLPKLPPELVKLHAKVAAYAPVPMLKPMHVKLGKAAIDPNNRYGATSPFYWYDDLKQAYSYPSYTAANGAGRTMAVVAASDFLDSDVAAYFGHEGLAVPNIVRRPVDGGSPAFNINSGLSDEVSLDVQQSTGSAPGATLMVYEAPDASFFPSFFDMYTAIDEDNKADVVSTSFGLCELFLLPSYNGGTDFTPEYLGFFHDLFLQGNAQGITFLESSGDNGAQGGECTDPSGAKAVFGVSFWADDPNVTGVGGTNLMTSNIPGSLRSTYIRENAFANDWPGGFAPGAIWGSGGGISVVYGKPSFQNLVNTGASMRAVPDIAMMMGGCPGGTTKPCGNKNPNNSAFVTALQGQFFLFIGTSGSSPDFAGLQAIQDQVAGGRAGNVNNVIYELAALGTLGNGPIFHNNIPGNNGYQSHQGYNFVVGNGTPYGAQYALDPTAPLAGDPQTPSNP
ncbi:MAG TPA: S53 family serine peptidase [Candidatus Baltobacteraceae bacterium]|nr:S53 family serine peptidase [Candidatus Baltobacteraceae bacterium]